MIMSADQWLVLKFGGTSVSSVERWEAIADILRKRLEEPARLVVVCSALSGVSNLLEAVLARAEDGLDTEEHLARLRRLHEDLARGLGVSMDGPPTQVLDRLGELLEGVALTREWTPRLEAQILSAGELLSTHLGAAWLKKQGFPVTWKDARHLLEAEPDEHARVVPERQYLAAQCSHESDSELKSALSKGPRITLTQGFIARLSNGDTVLLGRGGSDTAAAYLACRLDAERLEIWTDVPGMFTANPTFVEGALAHRSLSYDVARELASKGGKVLHPRCILPAADKGIPIWVRSTREPDNPGTVLSGDVPTPPSVRAVTERRGFVLVSMDVEPDWQGVGVIADVATCFKDNGLSIDALTSSQTNLVAALDPGANRLDDDRLAQLLDDLSRYCKPRLIRPVASVSLVGTGIRAIVHEWAVAFEHLRDQHIYMVSQAANDLSVTFIVNESSADELVRSLHEELFEPKEVAV